MRYAYSHNCSHSYWCWCVALAYQQIHPHAGYYQKYSECSGGYCGGGVVIKSIWCLG